MTDGCPTHGAACPGHLHAEVAGGKVYVSRPGTPVGPWLAGDVEPVPSVKRPATYPIDLEKVRWLTKEPPLTRMEREEIPWPDADHPFPFYVHRWQAEILDRMMERRRDDTR